MDPQEIRLRILELLNEGRKPIEISKITDVSKQRINYHIRKMQERGYLTKIRGKYIIKYNLKDRKKLDSIKKEFCFENFLDKIMKNTDIEVRWEKIKEINNETLKFFKKEGINAEELTTIGHFFIYLSHLTLKERIKEENKNFNKLKEIVDRYDSFMDFMLDINLNLSKIMSFCNLGNNSIEKTDLSNSPKISLKLKKRYELLKKYDFSCAYCGRSPPEVKIELEHKKPKSKGGNDNMDNLVPSCKECNLGKYVDSSFESGGNNNGKGKR